MTYDYFNQILYTYRYTQLAPPFASFSPDLEVQALSQFFGDEITYGGHVKGEVYGFFKEKWPEIERRMSFPETYGLDQRDIERYENMSDEEWYKRKYTKELRDFSDEEIAAEFNRRINSPVFHNLTVEVKAVVANRR